MTYLLYYSPGACSLAAHIILREVGADFELSLVSTAKRETTREPYLTINPKGRVPVLRIPGELEVLTELPAILLYLARRYPSHALVPAGDPLLEARCAEWLAWLTGWVHSVGYGLIWRPERFDPDVTRAMVLEKQGRQTVEAAYMQIEKRLSDERTWCLGDRFSIVDPFLLVLYRWGNRIKLAMRQDYPSWSALSHRTIQRPTVEAALQAEGVSIDG